MTLCHNAHVEVRRWRTKSVLYFYLFWDWTSLPILQSSVLYASGLQDAKQFFCVCKNVGITEISLHLDFLKCDFQGSNSGHPTQASRAFTSWATSLVSVFLIFSSISRNVLYTMAWVNSRYLSHLFKVRGFCEEVKKMEKMFNLGKFSFKKE